MYTRAGLDGASWYAKGARAIPRRRPPGHAHGCGGITAGKS